MFKRITSSVVGQTGEVQLTKSENSPNSSVNPKPSFIDRLVGSANEGDIVISGDSGTNLH